MGRDVTGIRNDMRPNGMNFDRVHVAPTIASDKIEEPEQGLSSTDHNFKGEVREDVQGNQEVLAVKSTNIESGVSSGIRAKIEALKPKLSVKASPSLRPSPSLKPPPDAEASETIKLSTPKAQVSEEDDGASQSIKVSTPRAQSSEEDSGASESIKISTPRAQPSDEVSDATESKKLSTPKAHQSGSGISNASYVEIDSSTVSSISKKNDSHSPVDTKTAQPQSPSMSVTSSQYDTEDKHHDEEDNCSFTSSGGTYRRSAAKFKPTVPVGPKFVCGERVARRKEYYKKLEEKQKAMEAERLAEQARIKEEEEAALQKLRRSMSYKANPVPSFYREGPPPKAKLKKLPLTRPKSPNLTRAKSFTDSPKSARSEKISCSDVSGHNIGKTTATNKKDLSGTKIGSKKVKAKVGQEKDITNAHPSEVEQIDSDKCVVEGKNTSPTAEHSSMPSTVTVEDAQKA